MVPPSRMTVVSRKETSVVDHSTVNLMVGWKVLVCWRKDSSSPCPLVQMAKTTSTYVSPLYARLGCCPGQ